MPSHLMRMIGAGLLGTLVMTAVGVLIAPMMGLPAMNPADMLAAKMGGSVMLGWAAHIMIGVVLAIFYGTLLAARLPGPPALRGVLFSLLPWLMAQVLVLPMMGMPLFSGSAAMAGGSLLGHMVYGAVIGAVIGTHVTEGARA